MEPHVNGSLAMPPIPPPTVEVGGETYTLIYGMAATRCLAKAGVNPGEFWDLNQKLLAGHADNLAKIEDPEAKSRVLTECLSIMPKWDSLLLEFLAAFTVHNFSVTGRIPATADQWAIKIDACPAGTWNGIRPAVVQAFLTPTSVSTTPTMQTETVAPADIVQ